LMGHDQRPARGARQEPGRQLILAGRIGEDEVHHVARAHQAPHRDVIAGPRQIVAVDADTELGDAVDPRVQDRIFSADQLDLPGRRTVGIVADNETDQAFQVQFGAADLPGMTNVENSSDLRIIMDAVNANLLPDEVPV